MFDSSSADVTLFDASALRETLDRDFISIVVLLHSHFNDVDKVVYWLYAKNPMLGGVVPMSLIAVGRGHKVLRFIEDSAEGKIP
jgi:hypothetical protein